MNSTARLSIIGASALALLILIPFLLESVGTGQIKVATKFGKVTGQQLSEGLHFPVNPILSWDNFNTLERSILFEGIGVPAVDQMEASMDISVQFRLLPDQVVHVRRTTGDEDRLLNVHFLPNARGVLRDAGRSTKNVEAFFDDTKITEYRLTAKNTLNERLVPEGIEVLDVIVRNVTLPQVITTAIETKKKREQEVQEQQAKLETQKLVAEETVQLAQADRDSAILNAEAKKTRANARAYEIAQIQRELAKSPNFIKLVQAEQWDGKLPTFMGSGVVPFLDITDASTP